jgi:Uma2 family endonuclease
MTGVTAMTVTDTERVTEETYRRLALGERGRRLELHGGRLREKPGMSVEHGDIITEVAFALRSQLDRDTYRVRVQHARLRVSPEDYYVPDVAVVPAAAERALRDAPGSLDAYPAPLPLVVEVWSPSTGSYDLAEKLPGYQRRGDEEIWRLHPFERTLTAWRRRPDGGYDETTQRGGIVRPTAVPEVEIDLDVLFAG